MNKGDKVKLLETTSAFYNQVGRVFEDHVDGRDDINIYFGELLYNLFPQRGWIGPRQWVVPA